jgi:serine protease Do
MQLKILKNRIPVIYIVVLSFIFMGSFITMGRAAEKSLQDLSNIYVQIAKKVIPSVVHIEVTARQEVANPFLPFENDPFFRRFFDTPDSSKKFKRDVKGIGTGMIIDSNGNILTNYHVAGGATKIEVLLADGEKYSARLIGGDPKTDLAVIRIDSKKQLPYVMFGDSDKIEVGEWIMAIGHPRGLDQTVTHGIISAKHRRGITDPSSYQDFIQTDAAINPGNSGGPLLNLKGEVIGVNTVIVSSSGGFEGIGLAIPSNIATHVAKTLIAYGKVERGWLGVSAQDLTPDLAKLLGIGTLKGAIVVDVAKGSPAEKAGVKKDDVVTSFNGKTISDGNMLRNEVAVAPIGKEVKLTVLRGARTYEFVVRVGDLKAASASLSASVKEKLGAEVRTTTQKEADRYRLDPGQGIVITKVEQNGPLGRAGFETNDMILEINGQALAGLDSFIELVGSLKKNQRITLLALDGKSGKTGYIQVIVR